MRDFRLEYVGDKDRRGLHSSFHCNGKDYEHPCIFDFVEDLLTEIDSLRRDNKSLREYFIWDKVDGR